MTFVAVYLVAAKVGFRAAFVAEQVSPVWPPAGLALWALLYLDRRLWPAVWVGALLANATTHVPLLAASVIATGNTLEAVAAVWLMRRVGGVHRSIDGLRHMTTLIVGAAVVSTAISATIGVTTLCVAGVQPWARYSTLWSIWWLGDATGDLLLAPALLTMPLWWRTPKSALGLFELVAMETVTVVVSLVLFGLRVTAPGGHYPVEFAVFPLVIWAGLRFAHPGAALVSTTVSAIAVWGTLHGTGPFSGGSIASPQDSLILLQIYTAVIATSGLVFGAAIADRRRSERLREADHALTAILSEENDLSGAAPRILHAVCATFDWDVGLLWLAGDDRQTLEYVDGWRTDARFDAFIAESRARRFERGVGLPGRVWESAQPAWIDDVVTDPNFPRAAAAGRLGLHGGFAFPISLGSRVVGLMEFFAHEPRTMDGALLSLMAAAGSQIGQFIWRRRAQQRLIESEALNSAILNAAIDAVISIDGEGRILEFNPSAAQTFGIVREQAIGRELASLLIPERLRDVHRDALRRTVESGEARVLGKRVEMPALRGDGSEFVVELAITRVTMGERPVFTAHIRDITERKRMEHERAELLARERSARMQAEDANRTKDQFLATVSHELRTPLTAILGWTSMLRTREFPPERLQQILEGVYRNAQTQTQIVNDLLDVSRIVTGQLRLDLQPIDVRDVARQGLETLRPTAIAKNVALESDFEAGSCVVYGDPARLQQVIWNLLSNAIKFTPSGGTVTLSVRVSASNVHIEVTDTGLGIPPEFLPHVFERFWQADSTSTRVHGGLGLGLALVRHLAELHGGDVRATSAGENKGSTFRVTLPARLGSQKSSPSGPGESEVLANDLTTVTVLVVDDDQSARELFEAVLTDQGARVMIAGSADEAFSMFERERIHVALIDVGMRQEDGFKLLRRMRAHEAANGLPPRPALAVTAYVGAVDREKALQAGFAEHIPKPVLPHDLVSAVLRAVNQQPTRT